MSNVCVYTGTLFPVANSPALEPSLAVSYVLSIILDREQKLNSNGDDVLRLISSLISLNVKSAVENYFYSDNKKSKTVITLIEVVFISPLPE